MPDTLFDRKSLQIDPAEVERRLNARKGRKKDRRAPPAGKYVKGPLPVAWLQAAGALPGKAVLVGLTLWYLRGMKASSTVRLTGAALADFGVGRWVAYRGLRSLEETGLVKVERRQGQSPLVTILDAAPSAGTR